LRIAIIDKCNQTGTGGEDRLGLIRPPPIWV
jgi:hypothetical protein